jgi:hypothetical protein
VPSDFKRVVFGKNWASVSQNCPNDMAKAFGIKAQRREFSVRQYFLPNTDGREKTRKAKPSSFLLRVI